MIIVSIMILISKAAVVMISARLAVPVTINSKPCHLQQLLSVR